MVGELLDISGRRECEIVGANVLVLILLTNLGVRADSKALHADFGLSRPLPQRLREQRNGWHQKQSGATFGHQLFSDLQGCESLPRAASHDELATITFLESLFSLLECLFLVFSEFLLGLELDGCRLLR